MKPVVDGAEHLFRDWVGLLLVAIGWNAPVSAWFGGVIMAMGGASLARAMRPERDKAELWAVLGTAFFVAHMAGAVALLVQPGWPVQLIMGVAGLLSRFALRLVLDVADRLSGKGARVADGLIERVLPAEKDDKE